MTADAGSQSAVESSHEIAEEFFSMFKRTSLTAVLVATTLIALPTTSEARSCRLFDRVEVRTAAMVDDTGRMFRRVGDGVFHAGDRMFGWVFCKRHRV